VALDLREFISADQPAEDILKEISHYPYIANSDFHKAKHLYSWKTPLRCEKTWESIARTLRANVDVALTLYRKGSWAA